MICNCLINFFKPFFCNLLFYLISDIFICSCPFEQTVQQCLYVHCRSADGHNRFISATNIGDCGLGKFHKSPDTERLTWLDYIDQVIWYLLTIFGGRFGRPDVHSPIDLHRIDTDDLAAD